ncbi:Hint domain-containing protein [Litoreibacter janthinus]|uniref:Hint domain-containing protein n=1 Tax=Litoreibacter janthinus TaxID=670154 RepID=A0A1I6G854_9RHOB|nr:Hint domain-containing protein [Litoreibacter janthinus]SFR38372.1 Hint domain-containing protein [Litoreibacter janthinus]
MAELRKPDAMEPEGLFRPSAAARLPISGFGAGTLITCDEGDIPVEWLRAGDRVLTYQGDFQPVRWIGRDCLRHAPEDVAAVRLAPRPIADRRKQPVTVLAARHRVLLCGWQIQLNFGLDTVLAEACDLEAATGHFAPLAPGATSCSLLVLNSPQVIRANGFWVESFQMTPEATDCLDDEAADELGKLAIDRTVHTRPATGCLQPWEAQGLGLDLASMIVTEPGNRRR